LSYPKYPPNEKSGKQDPLPSSSLYQHYSSQVQGELSQRASISQNISSSNANYSQGKD
jgi:hypothetical protein